jgi:hypothetical protein
LDRGIELPLFHLYPLPWRDIVDCCSASRREPECSYQAAHRSDWLADLCTNRQRPLSSIAGLDHHADGYGRHTISGVVRVALVRLGEFESGMTAVFLGEMPAVVLGGFGTIDVGRSLR